MIDPIEVLWTPAGQNLPSLGARALVDVSDGDTPNIRMPVRMLSIDTPEVTAKSTNGAARVDAKFADLIGWLKDGTAPVKASFRDHILPKLEGAPGGSLQFEQGQAASAFYKEKVEERLRKPSGRRRNLFVRSADEPFDGFGRLLAYVAPSYTKKERDLMSRRERSTFNLDLIESGWAAPFVLFPSIPGELDLPLFVEIAQEAMDQKRGQYGNDYSLTGYEYRMLERLHGISKKLAEGESLSFPEQLMWRTRYCADIRDRSLHGPEDYMSVSPPYRLWIWPDDVQEAIARLNLVPAKSLTS